ncbi:MAG: hypothetical protein ACRDE5_05170 [Ginsengibacter sp.]
MITTDYNPNMNFVNPPIAALVDYSTRNFIDEQKKLNENLIKLQELKNDIGENLFNSLGDEDKNFILKTEGSVDFGYKINSTNLREIEKYLREDYEY